MMFKVFNAPKTTHRFFKLVNHLGGVDLEIVDEAGTCLGTILRIHGDGTLDLFRKIPKDFGLCLDDLGRIKVRG